MPTILEHLPDEIFFEIFEYIPMKNLYRSFSRLNYRINSILGSIQPRLALQYLKPNEIHDPSVIFFANYIRKLSIWHSNSLNLINFSNIRSLELEHPTIKQLNEIRPHTIPQLEYLRINNNNTRLPGNVFYELCHSIFSGEFSHLHTCILNNVQFDCQWSLLSCKLRSIQVNVKNCQDLSYLLNICPELIRLKVMLDDEYFHFHYSNISQTLCRLDLYLRINNWSCEELESLLIIMPNLKYLSIETPFGQRSQMTVESLANVLRKCTPLLENFFINTIFKKQSLTDDIHQLHPLFKVIRVIQAVTTRADHITISSKINR
ncbi:unnamed protein product [Rotaria sp. Silwood2]|nr:unnamed protein product [Rotaria sp. Silwood2]CAF2857805.1 unnamed protein product [Rotaria sp. Silwood2]CAF4193923.1 unnamed protein product [Rotaria sp. Silwood2]CAF4421357.1 unnamed protein product [Rotaria sp. Silwood2]